MRQKSHPLNNDGSCPTMRSSRHHHRDVHHYFHFHYFRYFHRNRDIHNHDLRSRSRRRPSLPA